MFLWLGMLYLCSCCSFPTFSLPPSFSPLLPLPPIFFSHWHPFQGPLRFPLTSVPQLVYGCIKPPLVHASTPLPKLCIEFVTMGSPLCLHTECVSEGESSGFGKAERGELWRDSALPTDTGEDGELGQRRELQEVTSKCACHSSR